MQKRYLFAVLGFFNLAMPVSAWAVLPAGTWHIFGTIEDERMFGNQSQRTNNISFEGHSADGCFIVDTEPGDSEDDIAESAAWDGHLFYLIQRYPKEYGKHLARTESLGKVEPTVFSRYATHGLTSVLLACADTNALNYLQSGKDIFILGNLRRYPEENDTFHVNLRTAGVDISATCYGGEERGLSGTMVSIQGFPHGFTRWTYKSDTSMTGTNGGVVSVCYERYYPFEGKLNLERRVMGKIILSLDTEPPSSFRPKITESDLLVDDYRFRAMLLPYSKGYADQCHMYELTGHAWDCDTNAIYTHFSNMRSWFSGPGLTNSALRKDEPFRDEAAEAKRPRQKVIVRVLLTFSLLFPSLLLFNDWRAKRRNQITKHHNYEKNS